MRKMYRKLQRGEYWLIYGIGGRVAQLEAAQTARPASFCFRVSIDPRMCSSIYFTVCVCLLRAVSDVYVNQQMCRVNLLKLRD